ncbi:MAG: hypothetical protein AB1733_14560, partial [Thermodesulfobacteriota bacterium]
MVMIYETLILAVATLIAPLFGKMAGCELHGRPFGLVGASGLFFLLTVAFSGNRSPRSPRLGLILAFRRFAGPFQSRDIAHVFNTLLTRSQEW